MLGKLVTGVESITRDAREAASRAADRAKSIEANGESSAAPRELGRRVAEIGVIVETVNTLAERTNLLSLNAAIEGAHAGDAGRGFVVIAEELRALSERAARAVHDVTSLIHGLNSVVQDAVDAVVDAERRAAMASTEVRDLSVATAAHADALLVLSQSATEARRAAEELARSTANQAHATQEALTTAQHAVTAANEVRAASAAQASSISDLERSGDVARRAAASTSRRLKEHASSAAQAAMDAQTLARNGSDVEAALATAVDETTTQRAQIVAADEQRAVGVEGVARTLTELRALTLRTARTANDSSMVSAALQQRVTSLS
jgi:methyl-accepting chemotaxis protein